MTPEDMYNHMEGEIQASGRCVGCHTAIVQSVRRGRTRKWCSDECREQALRLERKLARPAELPCEGCGVSVGQKSRGRPIKWCSERCRKRTCYAGTCEECGAPTSGDRLVGQSKRCKNCVVWTREAVIDAFNAWADEQGGIPPTCTEVRKCPAGVVPKPETVKRLFGSWNSGLLAAGFELKTDRRPETALAVLQAVRDGEHTRDIAERFGWTSTNNVHQRLRTMGTTIRAERPAWYQEPRSRRDYVD